MLQRHALGWLWFYKATFQLTDSAVHIGLLLDVKKITHNCTVKNVKQKYRIWYDFTHAQKQNPKEATEDAYNFFPKRAKWIWILEFFAGGKTAWAQS